MAQLAGNTLQGQALLWLHDRHESIATPGAPQYLVLLRAVRSQGSTLCKARCVLGAGFYADNLASHHVNDYL